MNRSQLNLKKKTNKLDCCLNEKKLLWKLDKQIKTMMTNSSENL